MRNKPNTLLAGVAALALFAGTGIALAQQSPQGQKSTPGMSEQSGMHAQSAKPAAKPDAGAGMEQHAQTGATGDKTSGAASNTKADRPGMAQQSSPGAKGENGENRSAEDIKGNKMGPAADKTAQSLKENLGANGKSKSQHERLGAEQKFKHNRSSAQNERGESSRMNSAQGNERKGNLKGLQGNTSLPMQGNVTLNEHQKTTIRDRVIDARGAPRVGHVDFDVAVGTVVPRDRINLVSVPETLVRIEPRWHGYLYFVYEDEIVIVNPHDMRIVAVVTV